MRQLIISLPFLFVSIIYAQTAEEIIEKAEDSIKGESAHGKIEMTIETPDYTRSLKMENWWEDENALIAILHPPKEEGNKTLKIGNEMWNYLANTETTIKIPPSMMLQSWNGSDFTNDDIVRESKLSEDYDGTIMGTETIDGAEVWKIELIPHEDAPVVWGKLIYFVRKDGNLPARVEYYDESGQQVRHMVFSEIEKFGGRRIPSKWEMVSDTEEGHSTTIKLETMEFDVDIPDRKFSFQELERGMRR